MKSPKTQAVIYGRRTESSPCTLLVIQNNDAGGFVETPMNYPCQHVDSNNGLFTVVREGRELLLISCFECRIIKLFDIEKMKVVTETKLTKRYRFDAFCVWPGPAMLEGETLTDDTVFIISKDGEIWHLDSLFKFIKKFDYKLGPCESACYLSAPHNALLVRDKCQIKAVSTQKNKQLWAKGYKQKLPSDLLFFYQNNLLVTSDPKKPQIHILNPTNGKVDQTLEVPNTETILRMSWCNDQLVMILRGLDQRTVLSCYNLTLKTKEEAGK